MTVVFSPANQAVVATPQDLIQSAVFEIGALAPGDALQSQDLAWGLEKLQRLIDQFNARRGLIFAVGFDTYNLTPNHAPHTIGPNGDFNVPIRPVDVISANFVLNSGGANPVDTPIKIKDDDWWAANPVKSQISSIVTHLYYEPASPLGNLNFWPTCTGSNPVRLETWEALEQAVSPQTKLGFVQGYWEAIIDDLAISLCSSYEKEPSQTLVKRWERAMQIIQSGNELPPRIETDSGMPNSRKGGRPDFNFLSGLRE